MRLFILSLIACLVLYGTSAHALSSDREKPATIEANQVEFDFRTGKRTYKGNVVIVQGTLRITGEKVVVQYDNENQQIQTATSWGNPATFKQRPDGKEHDVYGEGDEIVLNEIENTLTLIENAVMTQAGNTAKGNKIIYDIATDRMTVKGMPQQQEGGGTATTDPETGRARVIITPEEQQQSSGTGASSGAGSGGETDSDDDTSGARQGAE